MSQTIISGKRLKRKTDSCRVSWIPSIPFSNISKRIPKRRIAFIDELRAISIMSLVLINTSTLLNHKGVFTYEEYVLFSTMAFGVPIFLMLLGTLMLERDYYDEGFNLYKLNDSPKMVHRSTENGDKIQEGDIQ